MSCRICGHGNGCSHRPAERAEWKTSAPKRQRTKGFARLELADGGPLIVLRDEVAALLDEGNGTTAVQLKGSDYTGTVKGKADDVFATLFLAKDGRPPIGVS